jgi:hypothetical protein
LRNKDIAEQIKCYQVAVQWVLGGLTNDPDMCSRYAGLYKGTSGAGLCISFILDAAGVPFIYQLTVQFVCYACGITALLFITVTQIKETNYFLEENIIAPHRFEDSLIAKGTIGEEQMEREKRKERLAKELDEKRGAERLAITQVAEEAA